VREPFEAWVVYSSYFTSFRQDPPDRIVCFFVGLSHFL